MSEERAPYVGENDPPAPSMMDRLVEVLRAELARANPAPSRPARDAMHVAVTFAAGDPIDHAAIIRAVLTELRTIAGEIPVGMIVVEGQLTADQAAALRNSWRQSPSGVVVVGGEKFAAPSPMAFIDAILAQGGGSEADQIVSLLREAEKR